VAVDAAGNVYIGDSGSNSVKKVTGGGSATPTVIGSGFNTPCGVAVDAAGNVYVADYGNNAVKKIAASNGAVTTLGSGFSHPFSVAVDAAGNVYVGDFGNNAVKKIPAGGGTPVVLGSGFVSVYGVAVDNLGNVFVADRNANAIKIISIYGGAPYTIGSNVAVPYGVAVDGAGNVYVTDAGNNMAKEIKLTGGYYINPVLPGGLTFSGVSGLISGTPGVASPATNYTITGYNTGGSKSAVTNIKVNGTNLSNNASLSALTISAGTLTPVFATATLSYTASVANSVSSITITPTVSDATATIKVNGVTVASGSASASIPLNAGTNSIATVVTAQDGVTTKTYTVTVTRAPSTNASLSGLTISAGTLAPAFATGTLNYTASVTNGTTSINVVPTFADATATATLNGTAIASGATGAVNLSVGANVITIVLTAQDGTTIKTYKVTVTRAQSSNANLAGLALSAGTLTPVFSGATINYTATVPSATASINVVPTFADATATATLNGTAIASGATAAVNLSYGSNVISIVVTAQNGTTTKTYTVTVTRPQSTNASLAGLTLSTGTLSPAFAAATISYTASVPNATASITETPVTADATATVTVNGSAVTSGTASGSIALVVGVNTITTVVTAQDGTTTKTYTVKVTRQPAVNANLSALTISSGTLSPVFAAGTTTYSASVVSSVASITVTPTATLATSTITVNGTAVASGTASAGIPLIVGLNAITTVVTASNGTTTKTYTINVTRAEASDPSLSSLSISSGTLSPAFSSAVTNYSTSVSNATTSVTLTMTPTSDNASMAVNGMFVKPGAPSAPVDLNVGPNTITIVVTAPDGVTTETYTIVVNRIGAANANLAGLTLSSGTLNPVFATATVTYHNPVGNAVTSITITPTTSDVNATVKVNGVAVTSGSASAAISLNVGVNVISTVVTAQDGTTTKTYTVTVNRAASSNANLSALHLSAGALSPAFGPGTINYTASVVNGVSAITVTPTTSDAGATVKINGTVVASGSASASLPLSVGQNTITTVVTAANGTTVKTYTVTVTRAASTNANLLSLKLRAGVLSPAFASGTTSYTANVVNGVSTDIATPTVFDATATITVNGTAVASGTASGTFNLAVGPNMLTVVVTAQDGITTKTYTVTITRAAGPINIPDEALSVDQPVAAPQLTSDAVNVHQGVSPNGDGINDFLQIDGIAAYPDNRVTIMNRNGALVYEAKGYDNSTRVFDGHSNKTGALQLPGTYYYSLEYTVDGVIKHKTGFIILKY